MQNGEQTNGDILEKVQLNEPYKLKLTTLNGILSREREWGCNHDTCIVKNIIMDDGLNILNR